MKTYRIWTSDGKLVTVVKGSSLNISKDGFIYVLSGSDTVAAVSSQGGFAIVLED